jgi:dihydroflavonol-4-reductase
MSTKVLVTGATGFLGSSVARYLIEQGFHVRTLVRPQSNQNNLLSLDIEKIEGDLTDSLSLKKALAGCDYLFHVAADYRLWVPNPDHMMKVNVSGTIDLVERAIQAGVKKIVYTSSVAVLGHSHTDLVNEETPSHFNDMIGWYKKSKYLAEQKIKDLIHEKAYPITIVNPSTPIGPRDIKPTPTGRIVLEAAKGHIPAYVETGLNIVHVDDVAMGHHRALMQGKIGERYILGGENWTLSDILAHIALKMGRKAPLIKLPRGPLIPLAYLAEMIAHVTKKDPILTRDGLRMARWRMWFSSEKAIQFLGYQTRPASEALDDSIQWFSKMGYLS